MDKRLLTAPCGLDCFNCPVQESNITDEVRNGVAGALHISPEEAGCKGCKPEQGRCRFTQDCATWDCAAQKGVAFCYECDDFPCGLLAPTLKGAEYPHNMKVYNLCRMKLIGIDGWIEETPEIRDRYYNGELVIGQGPVIEKDAE